MNFIIYDLEATCWMGRPPRGVQEIIEIGAYKLDDFGEIVDKFNRFVRPVVSPVLSGFCKRLTSIRQEEVNRAKTFKSVGQDFIDWVGVEEAPFKLCSWGELDRVFLQNDCILHNMDTAWLDHTINLKNQYTSIYNYKNPVSLKKAIRNEGHEFEGVPHRAISDAYNLVKIFQEHIDAWVVTG